MHLLKFDNLNVDKFIDYIKIFYCIVYISHCVYGMYGLLQLFVEKKTFRIFFPWPLTLVAFNKSTLQYQRN